MKLKFNDMLNIHPFKKYNSTILKKPDKSLPNRLNSLSFFVKEHIYSFLFIFVIVLFFLHNLLTTQTVPVADSNEFWANVWFIVHDSVKNYHQFYFWDFYTNAGQPFSFDPQVPLIYFSNLLSILINNPFVVNNLMHFFHYFIAGIGMYLLVFYLINDKRIAIVSSVIYLFNGYRYIQILEQGIGGGYAYSPLIILCVIKAAKERGFFFTILTGILAGLQILSGGTPIFAYIFPFCMLYLIFTSVFEKNKGRNIVKGIIILALILGIGAVHILPAGDHIKYTQRADKLSFQEYSQRFTVTNEKDTTGVVLKYFWDRPNNFSILGFVPFFLVLLSLFRVKNKYVLFFSLSSILCLVYIFFTPLHSFVYNYIPFFGSSRHVDRILFAFVTFASILAGFGLKFFITEYNKFFRNKRIETLFVFAVLAIIIIGYIPGRTNFAMNQYLKESPESNPLFMDLSSDKSIFRINSLDLYDPWATPLSFYTQKVGLRTLEASTASFWYPESVIFYKASENALAKMRGMLNTKYFISNTPKNETGFMPPKKYTVCEYCFIYNKNKGENTVYVYENKEFLPEAYLVQNSIIILDNGQKENFQALSYLILNKNYDPKSIVIIRIGSLENLPWLDRAKAIFIMTQPTQRDMEILNKFESAGGRIFPNIVKGENQIEQGAVDSFMEKLNGSSELAPIDVISYTPNKLILKGQENAGFLVVPEKYAQFKDDWKAKSKFREYKLYKANFLSTSVFYEGDNLDIEFNYVNRPIVYGAIITTITFIISFVLIIVCFRGKKNEK